MRTRLPLARSVVAALAIALVPALAPATTASGATTADDTPTLLAPKGEHENGSEDQGFDKLRDAYYWSRLLAGDDQLTLTQAATLRDSASRNASGIANQTVRGAARGGTWTSVGPDPIVQVVRTSNTFAAMSGRIGALAIRNDGTIILGAAQGGVWTYDSGTGTWTSRTNDADTQSVGALAIAPSDDNIVYLGTGEGALSGDSYYGDGIWRSADGGVTWTHVSSKFAGQATSAIVVDPTDPQHLYVATLRGRGGSHRTSAPADAAYGVYESTNGGHTWRLRKGTTDELHGATDLVMDPQHPDHLWASFWGDGIYRSIERRPDVDQRARRPAGRATSSRAAPGSRWASPTPPAQPRRPSTPASTTSTSPAATTRRQIFKSTDGGTTWTLATGSPTSGPDSVVDYCGTQCFYDNVVKPDPTNPDVVYAARQLRLRQQPAVRRHLPLDRRWRAPGSASATTCTRTSTRSPSSPTTPATSRSATTAACGSRSTGGGRPARTAAQRGRAGRTSTARSTPTPRR